MPDTVLKVENLSKRYRLGTLGHGALYKDLQSWWARVRGREDPNSRIPVSILQQIYSRQIAAGQPPESGPEASAVPEDAGNPDYIWALQDVSFQVSRGEVVGIIGKNGAGKSTLLKLISQITAPTTGLIKIRGRVASLLEVGTGFHPELTGRENIYLNGTILGMTRKEIDSKFDEIVAFSEMDRFIDTPVKRYSSGMYVRLAFSVAAHLEPDIFLIDEVLAVGDIAFQKKCFGKMDDVSRSGRTIFFVSHNLSAITSLCSTALLLDRGCLLRQGPTEEVVSAYVHSTLNASGEVRWDNPREAPGTAEVSLAGLALCDEAGRPVSVANIEKDLNLLIRYFCSVPGLKFRCEAAFYRQGVCAFTTLEPFELERPARGHFTSSVRLPGNLLAEGDYTVAVTLYTSREKKLVFCRLENALIFQVFDPLTGRSARGDFTRKIEGSLRPKLEWRLEGP